MANLDRMTARALVEAGYMPLSDYIELFGQTAEYIDEAPLVPDIEPQIGSREPGKVRNH